MDFGRQYSYFKEETDDIFTEPLFDELYMTIFVDTDHGYGKVTGRSIMAMFSVVGQTQTIWLQRYRQQ